MSELKEGSAEAVENTGESKTYLGMSGIALQRGISIMAGMGFLLFGYDQGVMGSLLTLDDFRSTFPKIDTVTYPDNATIQGAVISIYEIGCLMGALTTMVWGDKFGRRKVIFAGCLVMCLGAALQCSAFSLGHLIAGRIVTGVGNGMITSTVPMWQSECAKPENRGALVMIQGALITGGIMISYWVDFGFYFTHTSISWRFPIAFQIIFPLLIVPFIMKLPESPRWLLMTGRTEEARQVFAALENVGLYDPYINKEVAEVEASLRKEAEAGAEEFNFGKLLTNGETRNLHRTILAVYSQVMQQITGINLISYYAGTIFQQYIGMSAMNARILAACNGTEYFAISWVAFYTIEKYGRRKLMLFGAVGQVISMVILTATSWAGDPSHQNLGGASIAAAVFLFVFNSFFAIGWLGMTWLYPAEITPLAIRAPANGLSTAANWSFNFMVVMIVPVCFNNIGSYTYTVFAALNLTIIPVVYFFYPETAGRSLEEMDRIFALSNPKTPWDVVKIARELPFEYAHGGHDEEKAEGSHVEYGSDQGLFE